MLQVIVGQGNHTGSHLNRRRSWEVASVGALKASSIRDWILIVAISQHVLGSVGTCEGMGASVAVEEVHLQLHFQTPLALWEEAS